MSQSFTAVSPTKPLTGNRHSQRSEIDSVDPIVCLASSCIRIAFGPSVQLVADCLHCRGALNLRQIYFYLLHNKKRKCVTNVFISRSQIRASILVLLQHSVVTVRRQSSGIKKISGTQTEYVFNRDRAIYIGRYAKYVEYTRKAADATAACLVEELLLNGRLRTVDVVVKASEVAPKSDKYTTRQTVIEAFCKLVNTGFIEQVPTINDNTMVVTDNPNEGEIEFDVENDAPPRKKVKIEISDDTVYKDEDPAVVLMLKTQHHYRSSLPVDAVWRVNIGLFHDSFRALAIGKLVSERHGHKVQSAGSLVAAALRYLAHTNHMSQSRTNVATMTGQVTIFSTDNVVKYVPKPVLQNLERKIGGMTANLNKAFQELSERKFPEVVRRVGEDRYEITLSSLTKYLRGRIFNQVVSDRHGEVAARVISILGSKGWLESHTVAEHAMIPVKETREALHHLYRSGYIDLFHLSNTRQYNPGKAIYLWCLDRSRLMGKIIDNVATGLYQIRVRREHQVEVGKEWIERAQQAAETEENDHESDKLDYQKFCLGLERLDVAVQQLDETLMALRDF